MSDKPKRYRRPKVKEGEIKLYYGRLPHENPDICISYNGVPRCDSRLVMGAFTHDGIWRDGSPKKSFIDSLVERGYDINTLKFSVQKTQVEEQ